MRDSLFFLLAASVLVGLFLAGSGCGGSGAPGSASSSNTSSSSADSATAASSRTGEAASNDGAASDTAGVVRYEASLSPIEDSGVHGGATVRLLENEIVVTVEAAGLNRGIHAQHIHEPGEYTDCNLGRIEINLDESLDADSIGPFPPAKPGGTIVYHARADSLDRWRERYGPEIDLAGRVVALHVSSEDGRPPGPVAACGPLRRVR